MKVFGIIMVAIVLFSCNDANDSMKGGKITEIENTIENKEIWINDFIKFRDAVYHNKREEVKTYFDFPIKDNQEIWQMAYENDSFEVEQEAIQAGFTEADFDKTFEHIFNEDFVRVLLKIKSDSLLKNGFYETVELEKGDSLTYNIIASIENNSTQLMLQYNFEIMGRDSKRNIIDRGDGSVIYLFEVIDKKKIKFRRIEF